jgi:hypothetical protein
MHLSTLILALLTLAVMADVVPIDIREDASFKAMNTTSAVY